MGPPKSHSASWGLKPHHFEAFTAQQSLGKGWAGEQPYPWKGSVSLWDLPCFRHLIPDASYVQFDECRFGSPTRKPTWILYSSCPQLSALALQCNHPNGHPPVHGKTDTDGNYLTKSLAAYPEALNKAIAQCITLSIFEPDASPIPDTWM